MRYSEKIARLETFKKWTEQIDNSYLKSLVNQELEKLPDAFFIKPASSSGTHHPEVCRGESGLVIHTQLALNLGILLCDTLVNPEPLGNGVSVRDIVIASLILHDGYKYGADGSLERTDPDHPYTMADHLYEMHCHTDMHNPKHTMYYILYNIIRCHHGKWGKYPTYNKASEIVHQADYLACHLDEVIKIKEYKENVELTK